MGHTQFLGDPRAMRTLRERIEAAKIKLSVVKSVEVELPIAAVRSIPVLIIIRLSRIGIVVLVAVAVKLREHLLK